MRKGLVAILAVAIIGLLGIYGKNHSETAQTSANSSPPSVESTTTNTIPSSASVASTPATSQSSSGYKDGTYTGQTEQNAYGSVLIVVVISGGKITDVSFLRMPNDLGHTREVTAQSEPILKQETINAQSANIDFVSGATDTSFSYQKSLQAALNQAKLS